VNAPTESTGKRTRLPRLTSVDALRGVAALLVLLLHTGRESGPLIFLKPVAAFGWSGVGLFLVLSGFSIHFRWAASEFPHHHFTRGRFFQRRLFRLYPTYIAAVVLTILLTVALGISLTTPVPWVFTHGNAPGWLVAIVQVSVVPASFFGVAFVGVAWSLGLEIQLYVVYALLISRLRKIGIVRIVAGTLVVALLYRVLAELVTTSVPVGQFFPGGGSTAISRLLYAQLPSRAFEWFLGVLAAESFFGRVSLPRWTRSPAVAVGLILLSALVFRDPVGAASLNGHAFRVSDVLLDPLVGLAYFVLLQAAVSREEWLLRYGSSRLAVSALAAVGLFSYSLYLLHPILLGVSNRLLNDAHVGGTLETLIMWAFVLVVAWSFSRLIERPFITGAGDRWVLSVISRQRDTPDSRASTD
jgi:peptidoglycan/LPS O-acetylase OafA/YrhL